jgi:hypothetical protein
MAKSSRTTNTASKPRQMAQIKAQSRDSAAKPKAAGHAAPEQARSGWATDLIFDVREPKLAVSLRLPRLRGRLSDPDQRSSEGIHASARRRGTLYPCSCQRAGRTGFRW